MGENATNDAWFQCATTSAERLGQRDDDAFRAADVAEPVHVLVLRHLADERSAVGLQAEIEKGRRRDAVLKRAYFERWDPFATRRDERTEVIEDDEL